MNKKSILSKIVHKSHPDMNIFKICRQRQESCSHQSAAPCYRSQASPVIDWLTCGVERDISASCWADWIKYPGMSSYWVLPRTHTALKKEFEGLWVSQDTPHRSEYSCQRADFASSGHPWWRSCWYTQRQWRPTWSLLGTATTPSGFGSASGWTCCFSVTSLWPSLLLITASQGSW